MVHASRRRVPDRQHFNYFGACKSSGATPLSNRLSVRVGGCACGFHINLSLPSFNLLKPAIIQSIIHKQSRSRSRNGKPRQMGGATHPWEILCSVQVRSFSWNTAARDGEDGRRAQTCWLWLCSWRACNANRTVPDGASRLWRFSEKEKIGQIVFQFVIY